MREVHCPKVTTEPAMRAWLALLSELNQDRGSPATMKVEHNEQIDKKIKKTARENRWLIGRLGIIQLDLAMLIAWL